MYWLYVIVCIEYTEQNVTRQEWAHKRAGQSVRKK